MVCIYHILFSQTLVDGQVGCFHLWVIVTNAAMNMWVQITSIYSSPGFQFFRVHTQKWNWWIVW